MDVNHAEEADLETIAVFFASHGVTVWQCSILTDIMRIRTSSRPWSRDTGNSAEGAP